MPAALSTDESCGDHALVVAVISGELPKYRLLFRRHAEALQIYVGYRVWNRHLVSEIVHEAFVWAYGHLGEFQPGTSFQAWLRAIAWNLIRAEAQRFAREDKRRKSFFTDELWRAHLDDTADSGDIPDLAALRECLQRLPAASLEQRLIHLRYHDGLNSTQIAPLVSRSPVWVRVTLHRLLRQLRICVSGKRTAQPC